MRRIDQTAASEWMEQRLKSVLIKKRLRRGSHRLIGGTGRSSERRSRSEIIDEPHDLRNLAEVNAANSLGLA